MWQAGAGKKKDALDDCVPQTVTRHLLCGGRGGVKPGMHGPSPPSLHRPKWGHPGSQMFRAVCGFCDVYVQQQRDDRVHYSTSIQGSIMQP